jgi:hypothetical protein
MAFDDPKRGELVDALLPEDRLVLEIGRVVTMDVSLEGHLRRLLIQMTLTPATLSMGAPDRFDPVVTACIAALNHINPPQPWLDAGLGVFETAREAHRGRNRITHDAWVYQPGADTWDQRQAIRTLPFDQMRPASLQDAIDARLALRRAVLRVATFALAGWQFQRPNTGGVTFLPTGTTEDEVLRMTKGEFDLSDDGAPVPWV